MWTVDDVMAKYPCYSRKRVEKLFAGRTHLTLGDVWNLKIPETAKIWAICQFDRNCKARIMRRYKQLCRDNRLADQGRYNESAAQYYASTFDYYQLVYILSNFFEPDRRKHSAWVLSVVKGKNNVDS